MGGAVTLALPVLEAAVGVRVPTTRPAGAVQVVAAVQAWHFDWVTPTTVPPGSCFCSEAALTTGITDWPADQHDCIIAHHSDRAHCLPVATVSEPLVVAAVCKVTDTVGRDSV